MRASRRPLDVFEKNVAAALEALDTLDTLLPGLVTLTDDERRHSGGRFRAGEAEALSSVIDVAEAKPHLFEGLANADNGKDPARFETELLRDHLQRAAALQPLATKLEGLSHRLNDSLLHLGEETKPVMLQAYGLAKPQSALDATIRSAMAKAIDFFGSIGRASAATRKKKGAK